MTQEEKTLLLKDLCARIPYETMVECSIESIAAMDVVLLSTHIEELMNESLIIKPYLRPLSSMTEEECIEFRYILKCLPMISMFDFLNQQHLDYRRLIEKGLALEAPKGMYNLKIIRKND